jgi:hypothetical protein
MLNMSSGITFKIEEIENTDNIQYKKDEDIYQLLNDIKKDDYYDELTVPHMINYNENYTVKELLQICDYYGFAKDMKYNKFTKEQIIHFLVAFESDISNSDIVFKRQNMWFYMNELKNDKFMKKFILW